MLNLGMGQYFSTAQDWEDYLLLPLIKPQYFIFFSMYNLY